MKWILALLLCSTCYAKDLNEFTFKFHFPYGTQSNEFIQTTYGTSWEEAYKKATSKCVDHYLKIVRLDEETKLDIIDACVNPR
jgi:hypothetical protein